MSDSEKVREIERLRDEIIKHNRPADIKRLNEILQEGALEQKQADRAARDKFHDQKNPKRVCKQCHQLIHDGEPAIESMGEYWHNGDCPPKP